MTSMISKLTSTHRVVAAAVLTGAVFAGAAGQSERAPDTISLDVSRPGPAISPHMFGLFFEDINFAADGGLYPERVKNRSFEFDEPLDGWRKPFRQEVHGELIILDEGGLNESNPHFLRLRLHSPDTELTLSNPGFRGIGVQAGAEYVFSAYLRAHDGGPKSLSARVKGEGGKVLGSATLTGFTGEWKRYETTMRPETTAARADLEIAIGETGDLDIDMVSLYPKHTFKNRPNGLRPDLAQLLADMKPGFLRFPGGCIVEGRRLALRYDWKKTVGDISQREALINRWNDEFGHRPTPDYYQSFGLGFFEYFQLAEDIGAAPLPILNCGMACQFNSSELVPLAELDPFIQDALDLIEFANGSADTRWGGLRARMGHPAPFNLKMLGIGNEQWGPQYVERYERFATALTKAHPGITLVGSVGPSAAGPMFDYLWTEMRKQKAAIVDEHYYMPPSWFLQNAGRYDSYDRSGPRVFAGEYAAQTSGVARPDNRNNWQAALAEAAFITGLERNADVVTMTSYAPLFGHVDAWQWTPDLIWFDNLRSYGTPNYYVQKVYATNQGTHVLPLGRKNGQDGLYTSASIDQKTSELLLKAVNSTHTARTVRLDVKGAGLNAEARLVVLGSPDPKAENSLDEPTKLAPVEKTVKSTGSGVEVTLEPQSLTVVRVGYSR